MRAKRFTSEIHERWKNINEKFGLIDEISWVHRDKNGKVIKRYRSNSHLNRFLRRLRLKRHECIVAVGMANMAGLLLTDVGGTAYDYVAIGSGVGAAAVGNTALGTQEGVRQLATGTRVTVAQTNDTAQLVAVFSKAIDATLTGTDAITEVGVFYDAAGVTVSMLWRQTFAAESMDWDAGDTLTITCKTQMKQGA